MIHDSDENILKNREILNKFYQVVESQVKTFFLSKQVTYKKEFEIEYLIRQSDSIYGYRSCKITIDLEYKVWSETPLIDLYKIYLDEAWSKLLDEIEDIDIDRICVTYNPKFNVYNNWLEESER